MYGKRIKQLRKNAGLSQEELAAKVGISRPNISFWENSSFPPLDAIDRVCKALGMELWKFFLTDDAVSRSLDIPAEYLTIFQRLCSLDHQLRKDIQEIFEIILTKYENQQLRQDTSSIDNNLLQGGPDSSVAGTRDQTHAEEYTLNHYEGRAGAIAMEEYLNRFLWVNMFIQ
ncbi:MAG TPA: helix-turn-helix transcriptional regulator [Spirochaetota bacterium]|nr:helix-turn-helix transcriptional regulator [Spirochaetota bacterium]HPI90713.1 helix-turn-helix transcriptional regulator [Spirochaetota bacterium]HPR50079.1 helix-turn-helix transcriptional regulator [Spirochaetota bacterium]